MLLTPVVRITTRLAGVERPAVARFAGVAAEADRLPEAATGRLLGAEDRCAARARVLPRLLFVPRVGRLPQQRAGVGRPLRGPVEERQQPFVQVLARAAADLDPGLAQRGFHGHRQGLELLVRRPRIVDDLRVEALVDAAAHTPDLAAPGLVGHLLVVEQAVRRRDLPQVGTHHLQERLREL